MSDEIEIEVGSRWVNRETLQIVTVVAVVDKPRPLVRYQLPGLSMASGPHRFRATHEPEERPRPRDLDDLRELLDDPDGEAESFETRRRRT